MQGNKFCKTKKMKIKMLQEFMLAPVNVDIAKLVHLLDEFQQK